MNSPIVLTLPVGQLKTNCYVYSPNGVDAFIIDPGDDAEYIVDKIESSGLVPKAILATHGHYDHILAAFSLQAAYNIPFYVDKKDEFLLDRMRHTAIHFGEVDPGPAPIALEKFEIKNLKSEIKITKTPGHTPGSVSYYDEKNMVVFVGDLLFADGSIGEVTHKYSDRTKTKESVKKILTLPGETVVYPGHGEAATVAELKFTSLMGSLTKYQKA